MNSKTSRASIAVPVAAEPLSGRSDDALMLLARKDMPWAFDLLVRRHQQMVFRISAKYLGDANDAGEVTQRTFVEVYRYLRRYQPRGTFTSYLGRITLNQCRLFVRDRRYRNAAARHCVNVDSRDDRLPEDALLEREQRKRVEMALSALSPKLREALILRFAGELSYKEIAAALGIRMGTVKSRIFKGLEKMNQLLKDENYEKS